MTSHSLWRFRNHRRCQPVRLDKNLATVLCMFGFFSFFSFSDTCERRTRVIARRPDRRVLWSKTVKFRVHGTNGPIDSDGMVYEYDLRDFCCSKTALNSKTIWFIAYAHVNCVYSRDRCTPTENLWHVFVENMTFRHGKKYQRTDFVRCLRFTVFILTF